MKRGLWCVLLLLFLPGLTRADTNCYLMLFTAHGPLNMPRFSHTFATVVRVRDGAPLEAVTISWLPRSLDVKALRPWSEPGRNLDLHASLRLAVRNGSRITMWGPYRVHPELFDRAQGQKARLDCNAVSYKAWCCPRLRPDSENCIDAVEEIASAPPPFRMAQHGWGEWCGAYLVNRFRPWILEPQTHPWIGSQLGLSLYPIDHAATRCTSCRVPTP